ncbi:hypothetical protein [Mesorhizobium sp. ES1-1]|uniref:hypothetical protein n=1 Tax=Mesorhizobium sp. ES1-1 TaxID=2876629 RepID=UPI001CCD0A26|nr:hypothetical protein [Mesorhizobium sp. ES1-1]MBZ9674537.1 hypothetical protein [Mesorhizobium sp. ES1-1]
MNAPKLQLEAGKYYRTRDGRKAVVVGLSPFEGTGETFVAAGYIETEPTVMTWSMDGFFSPTRNNHHRDLVAEWVEPKRIKGFVALWDIGHGGSLIAGCSHVYLTLDAAKAEGFCGVIAYVEIDVLEGQGLDGEAGR